MKKIKLEEMTLEQKLHFVLCLRKFKTEEDVDYLIEMVKKRAVGSVQITVDRIELVERVRAVADYPILIICDMEQGFPGSKRPTAPRLSIGATDNLEYMRSFARTVISDAKAAGYNGTWSPIVDVLRGSCPCIVSRCYSDDPEKVALYSEQLAQIMEENNFLSSAKHYPGGQDLPYDTHIADGGSLVDDKELREVDLLPYLHLLKKGLLRSIMVGHHLFPKIDPEYPASLSKKLLDIIREYGFDGICFTDSFAMMSILQKYGEENIYGMAIAAGNDVVLPNYRKSSKECFEYLCENFRSGMFSEERLNEAVRRILEAQEFVAGTQDIPCTVTKQDEENLAAVARDSICVISDDGIDASLGEDSEKRAFVIMTELGFSPEVNSSEVTMGKWYEPRRVEKRIRELFPKATVMFMSEYPTAKENENLLKNLLPFDDIVFVTYCTTTAYLGTDCLTRRAEAIINGIIFSGKVSTIVHFGNPYAIEELNHVPRKIFGLMAPTAQIYAMDILAGLIEPKGILPVKLNLK